jgi:carboxypeptidase Q
MKQLLTLALVAACTEPTYSAAMPEWVSDTHTFRGSGAPPASVADHDREVAAQIIRATRGNRDAYNRLAELTDQIGNRLAGSESLDRAIAWAAAAMKSDGLEVHTEKVMVPHWVRGAEEAQITKPVARPLHVIALGGTVRGDVTAPIVVVHDWKELETKQVQGAIVVYNVAMPAYSTEHGSGYGETVPYRTNGAVAAAKRGAVASLVRSVTAHSLRTLHTGAMKYDDTTSKIPSAAITVEDAELLERLAARGPVTVHLHLEAQQLPDVESANVIGELRGSEHPDEIVLLGAHIDSWDVGQGAHDDGAGCVMVMQAAALLHQLHLVPRRTIRVVLYTNEENGVRGGKAYAKEHAAELAKHVIAIESDSGGFPPRGFSIDDEEHPAAQHIRTQFGELLGLVGSLGATHLETGHGGADISPLEHVLQVGFEVDNRTYFDIHHTEADTLDKVDPATLADDAAVLAIAAYVIADLPQRIDAP